MNRPSLDPYVHVTSRWQDLLDRLHIRIPYSLCGAIQVEEPGFDYPGQDGPLCPSCDRQITAREWFRMPVHERKRRAAEFKAADEALQVNSDAEEQAGVSEETETYHVLNSRVNDLWPSVPWWVRS